MKKLITVILFVNVWFYSSAIYAEKLFYETSGEYYMSELETVEVAKLRAKNNALQNIAEEFEHFIKSKSRMINSKLTDDEIIVVACNIIHILDVQYESSITPDGKFTIHRTKIKAQIDSEEFEKIMSMTPQDYQRLIFQTEILKQKIEKQNKRLNELSQKMTKVHSEIDKAKLKEKYSDAEKEFLLVEKFNEGYRFYLNGNYSAALEHFNEAVQLETDDHNIYSIRGIVYMKLGEYQKALNDFDRTIKLHVVVQDEPKSFITYVYCLRGSIYLLNNLPTYAIEDFNKSLNINSNSDTKYSSLTYSLRSMAYSEINKYNEAISDANKALEIDSNNSVAYNSLAISYMGIQNFDKALYNAKKLVEIEPNAENYAILAGAYYFYGNIQSAFEFIDKAITLNPNNAEMYSIRGQLYQEVGNHSAAQVDFEKAKKLGSEE